MALIRAAWVLATAALASSICWAVTLAPPDSAPGVVPFIVAFVGAALIAAATSYEVARRRDRTSLAPLVMATVLAVAVSEGGRLLIGALWPLTVPITLLLCAYSVDALRRVRAT